MAPFGMLLRVALVRTDVSGKRIASIIRAKTSNELGPKLAATNNGSTMMVEEIRSSETSVVTRAKRRLIPEDIIHSRRRENLKLYMTQDLRFSRR
jgi:hypothetical protein